jgi:hypothetical protein
MTFWMVSSCDDGLWRGMGIYVRENMPTFAVQVPDFCIYGLKFLFFLLLFVSK